jgi:mannose-6-phosphate isomerase-like protein (cupin superfamily)
MKLALLISTLLISAVSLSAAQSGSTVTYVAHDKVSALIAANGGALANGTDFTVSIAKRTAAGEVEVHDKETDTFYVLDGSATFVTGGTMVGGKVSRANQQVGTDITGGETRHLTKGDVITIPAGVPHWFKEVQQPFTYYMVKIVKP